MFNLRCLLTLLPVTVVLVARRSILARSGPRSWTRARPRLWARLGAGARTRARPGTRAGARSSRLFCPNLQLLSVQLKVVLVVERVLHPAPVGELDDSVAGTRRVRVGVCDLTRGAEVILQVLKMKNKRSLIFLGSKRKYRTKNYFLYT